MKQHPFIEHLRYRVAAALIILLAVALQACLFSLYGGGEWAVVLSDSLASTFVFAVLGYFAWYTVSLLDEVYKQAGIILFVQLLCLSASHIVLLLLSPDSIEWFTRSLPLRILFGILSWIILYQWYKVYLNKPSLAETMADTIELSVAEEKGEATVPRPDIGQRRHPYSSYSCRGISLY